MALTQWYHSLHSVRKSPVDMCVKEKPLPVMPLCNSLNEVRLLFHQFGQPLSPFLSDLFKTRRVISWFIHRLLLRQIYLIFLKNKSIFRMVPLPCMFSWQWTCLWQLDSFELDFYPSCLCPDNVGACEILIVFQVHEYQLNTGYNGTTVHSGYQWLCSADYLQKTQQRQPCFPIMNRCRTRCSLLMSEAGNVTSVLGQMPLKIKTWFFVNTCRRWLRVGIERDSTHVTLAMSEAHSSED